MGCVSINDMYSLIATDMLYSPIQRPRAKKNAVRRAFILKFNPRVAPTYVQACLYIGMEPCLSAVHTTQGHIDS